MKILNQKSMSVLSDESFNCFRVKGPLIDGFVLQSSAPSHHKKVKKLNI